ncbi:MAG: hypothetical protein IPK04_03150 [Bdellovibrionales bacterium]|nr:hypothetical protein [Bdellovibrionales bacterium]
MKEDLLYKIFHDHLDKQGQDQSQNDGTASDQDVVQAPKNARQPAPELCHTKFTKDVLVRSVSATYFNHLKSHGHIPFEMVKVVLDDLEQEVTEMYLKKTYGHFNLKSYLRQPKPKRK